VLHAILVDGMVEKIEGSAELAHAEIEKRREDGHSSSYLFAASSEKAYERKRNVRPLIRERAPV
jgi:hypothetical protein